MVSSQKIDYTFIFFLVKQPGNVLYSFECIQSVLYLEGLSIGEHLTCTKVYSELSPLHKSISFLVILDQNLFNQFWGTLVVYQVPTATETEIKDFAQ